MNTLHEVMSLLVIDAVELIKVLLEQFWNLFADIIFLFLVCRETQVCTRVNVQHHLFPKREPVNLFIVEANVISRKKIPHTI